MDLDLLSGLNCNDVVSLFLASRFTGTVTKMTFDCKETGAKLEARGLVSSDRGSFRATVKGRAAVSGMTWTERRRLEAYKSEAFTAGVWLDVHEWQECHGATHVEGAAS